MGNGVPENILAAAATAATAGKLAEESASAVGIIAFCAFLQS